MDEELLLVRVESNNFVFVEMLESSWVMMKMFSSCKILRSSNVVGKKLKSTNVPDAYQVRQMRSGKMFGESGRESPRLYFF